MPTGRIPPVEEMRPRDILAARNRCPCAFIPVSPLCEWHSFHLPLGTDGLIAEGLAAAAAEKVGGVYFRALPFGMDAFRTDEELTAWGLVAGERVFGMSFPTLPLASEYCRPAEMMETVRNRIEFLKRAAFRHIFLLNNHGGAGQMESLAELAREQTDDACCTHSVSTWSLIGDLLLRALPVGGHAGLAETTLLAAFRPELVDLSQLPEGELSVAETGILHDQPIIEAQWNPRHFRPSLAEEVRREMVENLVALVRHSIQK